MWTKRLLVPSCVLGLLIAAAHADGGAPPAPDPDRGAIAISVQTTGMQDMAALRVFFVRLEEGQTPFTGEEVIPSNFASRGQVYLLNAKPGRYVAVAAHLDGPAPDIEYEVFFSDEMVPLTEVTVTAGELVFMGDFAIKWGKKMKHADRVQEHYARLVSPEALEPKGVFGSRYTDGKLCACAKLKDADKGSRSERDFWSKAHDEVFTGKTGWKPLVERKLQTLRG